MPGHCQCRQWQLHLQVPVTVAHLAWPGLAWPGLAWHSMIDTTAPARRAPAPSPDSESGPGPGRQRRPAAPESANRPPAKRGQSRCPGACTLHNTHLPPGQLPRQRPGPTPGPRLKFRPARSHSRYLAWPAFCHKHRMGLAEQERSFHVGAGKVCSPFSFDHSIKAENPIILVRRCFRI